MKDNTKLQSEDIYTHAEAAQILSMSYSTLQRHVRAKKLQRVPTKDLPVFCHPYHVYLYRAEVDAYRDGYLKHRKTYKEYLPS